jgi:transposase
MDVLHPCCCGLDVHKRSVVACLISTPPSGPAEKMIRTFGAMTPDLLALADWLTSAGCTQVAMESTGVFWKPIYHLLEGLFELLLVTAQHLKAVPGRKTDVRDAEWIADLLRHGLLQPSFVPPSPQRDLRDLTRTRTTLVEERARIVNRIQKMLEGANLKLAAVATASTGLPARALLEALLEALRAGQTDPQVVASLARGKLRVKHDQLVQALTSHLRPHHAFLLSEHLAHLDFLDEAIVHFSQEIVDRMKVEAEAIALLGAIPGVSQRTAEILLADMGGDLQRFPRAHHLASWAGRCPGNNESAGKRRSGKTRKGSRWLRQVLIEAAHGAARTKDTYLSAHYHRLAARRGTKKALVALGHTILVIVYHVLTRRPPDHELGGNYFEERQAVERRLISRLELLGYAVTLQPTIACDPFFRAVPLMLRCLEPPEALTGCRRLEYA